MQPPLRKLLLKLHPCPPKAPYASLPTLFRRRATLMRTLERVTHTRSVALEGVLFQSGPDIVQARVFRHQQRMAVTCTRAEVHDFGLTLFLFSKARLSFGWIVLGSLPPDPSTRRVARTKYASSAVDGRALATARGARLLRLYCAHDIGYSACTTLLCQRLEETGSKKPASPLPNKTYARFLLLFHENRTRTSLVDYLRCR